MYTEDALSIPLVFNPGPGDPLLCTFCVSPFFNTLDSRSSAH